MEAIDLTLDTDGMIEGKVKINYNSRYDGVQVNAYILSSSELVEFVEFNGKKISALTRLYVARDDISNNEFRFKAKAMRDKRIRFRIAIIQEHKEIESKTIFLDYK